MPVTVWCEAQGKAQGLPFHPGVTGKGKTGRVKYMNSRRCLVIPSPTDGTREWGAWLAVEKRQALAGRGLSGQVDTAASG